MLLQVSDNVVHKSAEMAVRDPHGLIISIVSVAVVFSALVILYFAYTLIGKTVNGRFEWKRPSCKKRKSPDGQKGVPSDEEAAAIAMALENEMGGAVHAAIGMALHLYLDDEVHDNESYIITIRHRNR